MRVVIAHNLDLGMVKSGFDQLTNSGRVHCHVS
jgi:hypothetical protein